MNMDSLVSEEGRINGVAEWFLFSASASISTRHMETGSARIMLNFL